MTPAHTLVLNATAAIVVFAALFFSFHTGTVGAVAPNMHARVLDAATSSVGVYTTSAIAQARDLCASRVITAYDEIYLSFDSGFTPTTLVGHLQEGTSTVTYDAEQYGCGAITAIAGATTTITITEFTF